MVLATCLGAVLSRWSSQERLLLNLTLFDRLPLHKSVDKIIADFTNILLIDLLCKGQTIDKMAKENQIHLLKLMKIATGQELKF